MHTTSKHGIMLASARKMPLVTTTISKTRVLEHDIASLSRLSTSESTAYFFFAVGSKVEVSNRTGG